MFQSFVSEVAVYREILVLLGVADPAQQICHYLFQCLEVSLILKIVPVS